MTNTRRVQIGDLLVEVPVEVYARARAEAEMRVQRRILEHLAGELAEHPDHVEHAAWLLGAWNEYEDRMRTRLRLPPRRQDS